MVLHNVVRTGRDNRSLITEYDTDYSQSQVVPTDGLTL